MKLMPKLTLLFAILAIVSITIVGYRAYTSGRQTVERESIDHLVSTNILKSSEMNRWIEDNKRSLEYLAQRPQVRQYATVLAEHDTSGLAYIHARRDILEEHLKPRIRVAGGFFELLVICPFHGIILASTDERQEGKYRDTHPYFIEGKSHTYVQGVYYSTVLEQPAMTIGTPIEDKQGNLIAVLAGRLNLGELSQIMLQQSGMSQTEDTYLVNASSFFVTEPRFGQGYALKKVVRSEGVDAGLAGNDGVGFYEDYRGVPVIGAYKWLPQYKVCLITEVDQSEAYAPIYHMARTIAGIAFAMMLVAAAVGFLSARAITRPLQLLAKGAEEFGRGNLGYRVGTRAKDEIGGLSRTFDRMAEELKKTTVSRDEKEQLLLQRTTQLEAANSELEAFAYSVSHDLRAPLRAIDGYTNIIIEDYEPHLDAEGKRICSVIRENAHSMGSLIDDLLAFSRLGRAGMQLSRIDMKALANSVFFELTTPEERERIDFQVDSVSPASGDPSLLRQVWMNLLSNAVKFSSKRKKAVITVHGERRDNEVIYSAQDNGVGFDMQYVHKLFGVFQRLHSVSEFKGNGVGLAIVQRVIHRHGGRVWAEGEPGKGAAFYFTLPQKGGEQP